MLPWIFDPSFTRELPGDPVRGPGTRTVEGALWSSVDPTPVAAPKLLIASPECAASLGLDLAAVQEPAFVDVMAGNGSFERARPYAANYGGHQFGHWAGQLGDGRAIVIAEVLSPDGARHELQLKGAGPTPYSRRADGRAVLRSSIREFLCSEAMAHLGVPTTRALSLVSTGDAVVRDMFYDGHPEREPGAIVCRVAPTFLRFGSFELPASRGDDALLRRLLDYTVRHHFASLRPGPDSEFSSAVGVQFFREVAERTARLVALWQRFGFVHGVMNTDNLSILGLSIDYGPYGWVDDYDPMWTPNTTDAQGRRYAFGQQPQIAWWNLSRLAMALFSVVDDENGLRDGLRHFVRVFEAEERETAKGKLGLGDGEDALVRLEALKALLHEGGLDWTITFRALAELDGPSAAPLRAAAYDGSAWTRVEERLSLWVAALWARWEEEGEDPAARCARMRRFNPRFVLRNYLSQQVIDRASVGDLDGLHDLLDVMRKPFDDQPGREAFAALRPDWAKRKAGCSMLSCSS